MHPYFSPSSRPLNLRLVKPHTSPTLRTFDSHGTSCCLWSSWLKHFSLVGSIFKKTLANKDLRFHFDHWNANPDIFYTFVLVTKIIPPIVILDAAKRVSHKTWSNSKSQQQLLMHPWSQIKAANDSKFPAHFAVKFPMSRFEREQVFIRHIVLSTSRSRAEIISNPSLKSLILSGENGSRDSSPKTPCHAMVLSSKKLLSWTLDKDWRHGLQVAPSSAETFCGFEVSVHRLVDSEIRDWWKFHITFQVIIQSILIVDSATRFTTGLDGLDGLKLVENGPLGKESESHNNSWPWYLDQSMVVAPTRTKKKQKTTWSLVVVSWSIFYIFHSISILVCVCVCVSKSGTLSKWTTLENASIKGPKAPVIWLADLHVMKLMAWPI